MSEDTDLARLFAQAAEPPAAGAFTAGVMKRIARRRQFRRGAPIVLIAVLLIAVWATWPNAETFAASSVQGVAVLGNGVSSFFTSDIGTTVAASLALPLVVWAWATGRLRALR